VGALLLDKVFRESFLANPINRPEAVASYSQSYLRRFGETLPELTRAEQTLIASIQSDTIQHFCEVLDGELENDEMQTLYGLKVPPITFNRSTAA